MYVPDTYRSFFILMNLWTYHITKNAMHAQQVIGPLSVFTAQWEMRSAVNATDANPATYATREPNSPHITILPHTAELKCVNHGGTRTASSESTIVLTWGKLYLYHLNQVNYCTVLYLK